MLARTGASVSGVPCSGSSVASASSGDDLYLPKGHWQILAGYRWQPSSRPYIGTEEQEERTRLGTVSVNRIHLFDVGATYGLTRRIAVSASVPFLIASRTRPGNVDRLAGIPNAPDQIYKSVGFGDIAISARAWLIRPSAEKRQNVSIGFGVKLPTGKKDVRDWVNTPTGRQKRLVDQSIQLGDGGFGFFADIAAFKSFKRFTAFASGTYLFNPRNTNGVPAGRVRPSESVMSVSDQYMARAGAAIPIRNIRRGLAFTIGLRFEGVPSKDVFGKSNGFRRPGYAVSIEPGIIYVRKRSIWSVNVPMAIYRKRTRSVPEIQDNVRDAAAFADYIILVGYIRRF